MHEQQTAFFLFSHSWLIAASTDGWLAVTGAVEGAVLADVNSKGTGAKAPTVKLSGSTETLIQDACSALLKLSRSVDSRMRALGAEPYASDSPTANVRGSAASGKGMKINADFRLVEEFPAYVLLSEELEEALELPVAK
jgi:hypothetical protein